MALLRRLAVTAPRNVRVLSSAPPARDELDLTFNSPKDAFKSKKTSELVRAYLVYQICSVNWIVENNDMVRLCNNVYPANNVLEPDFRLGFCVAYRGFVIS
jgi:hypothetical protein